VIGNFDVLEAVHLREATVSGLRCGSRTRKDGGYASNIEGTQRKRTLLYIVTKDPEALWSLQHLPEAVIGIFDVLVAVHLREATVNGLRVGQERGRTVKVGMCPTSREPREKNSALHCRCHIELFKIAQEHFWATSRINAQFCPLPLSSAGQLTKPVLIATVNTGWKCKF
jgi:hypothetical protein